jgi:hypothetical protein
VDEKMRKEKDSVRLSIKPFFTASLRQRKNSL